MSQAPFRSAGTGPRLAGEPRPAQGISGIPPTPAAGGRGVSLRGGTGVAGSTSGVRSGGGPRSGAAATISTRRMATPVEPSEARQRGGRGTTYVARGASPASHGTPTARAATPTAREASPAGRATTTTNRGATPTNRGAARTSISAGPETRTEPGANDRPRARRSSGRTTGRYRDLRRVSAAALSSVVPGLGQLLNGRLRLAAWLIVPTLITAAIIGLVLVNSQPVRLAATVIQPQILDALLTVSLVLLVARLVVVGHAFFDGRYQRLPGRGGAIGLALVVAFVAAPHAAVAYYGGAARDAFGRFFEAPAGEAGGAGTFAAAPLAPTDDERLNVLLIGIDKVKGRAATLTDTMMVASLDRTLGSLSLVSVPRDLVDVPLGNGDVYGPKLNSLLGYAERHADEFPEGPIRTLESAIGTLLGIRIHYYATLDFNGFADLVDAVGGVVVDVKKGFEDPTYDGYGLDGRGWSIEPGRHLLDGPDALAYARSRKALGESDFTRQDRQQQIVVALRNRILNGGSVFFQLPRLLDTMGGMVRTDLPPERLPELAALADTAERDEIVRVVIQRPLIRPASSKYGSVQEPDLAAIQEMAALVLPPPGTPPSPWPPDEGSTAAEPSPAP